MVKDLKVSNVGQWYSKLKRLCSFDQRKSDPVIVESLRNLSDAEQAEQIADKFAKISQEFEPLDSENIDIPKFDESEIPVFTPCQVRKELEKIKCNKSVPPGDIPPKVLKKFAKFLAEPLCHIINASVKQGVWSKNWKQEVITPVPKVFPPKSVEDLRNISGLMTFNKIAEKLISRLVIADMRDALDPAQYANQQGISLQHYLVKMLDKILSDTDNSSKGESNAILAIFFDWKEAFPRQCPKLGIEAFLKCGVRPSLIPVLISYLQDRTMRVKWHNQISTERKLFGGGAQGSIFGIWQYLGQSNDNADCVPVDYRFKFVDDLSTLEKINLLIAGLASFNCRVSVPSHIPMHNQFIQPTHLKSQEYLDEIQNWTVNKKMILNQKKTKAMIFNFSSNYQFTTQLTLKNEQIEIVDSTKLLGVHLTNDLKWDTNTNVLIKKAYMRMELLRKLATFTNSIEDKKIIYILYIRSILEQSCVVWHSSLTSENKDDLERVQKCAVRIISGKQYLNYEEELENIGLETLEKRREMLCLKFAEKCLENEKTKSMFPKRTKEHHMKTREQEQFVVNQTNTERYKQSAIPYMQRQLNSKYKLEEKQNSQKRKNDQTHTESSKRIRTIG